MPSCNAKSNFFSTSLSVLAFVACSAQAAYVTPPYAGQTNSTSTTWNYQGDWYSGDSASHLTAFTHVDGYALSMNDNGCGPGIPCLVPNVIGTPLDFYIPNFVDSLPTKLLRIQYKFVMSALPNPDVQVIGFDPTVGSVIGQLLNASIQTDTFMTDGVFYSYGLQDWIIHPNPDFERITITGVTDSELREVKIDTISIPEPASHLLVGFAMLGLAVGRRRGSGAR